MRRKVRKPGKKRSSQLHKILSPSGFYVHSITAVAATCAILFLTLADSSLLRSSVLDPQAISEIGIEHLSPLTLSVAASTGRGRGILEITHDGVEVVSVSVPETWEQREVRDGSLTDVPSDPPTFGFRRWNIPGSVTVSFLLPSVPDELTVHNPSGISLKIRLTRVVLDTEEVERNVILVKDAAARLW